MLFLRTILQRKEIPVIVVGSAAVVGGMMRGSSNPSTATTLERKQSFPSTSSVFPALPVTSCAAGEDSPPSTSLMELLQRVSLQLTHLERTIGSGGATPASTSTGSASVNTARPTPALRQSNGQQQQHGIDVVLGAQWGDEGKGKLVDILSQRYDVCARVAGGSNAGHTIVVDGIKYKFHLLPSGVLNPEAICVIGNGVVVHIPSMLNELDTLSQSGIDWHGRVLLSDRAHLVFDFHMEVDGITETRLGRHKIGTTKKGIGPAYASKISRNGLRVGDLQDFDYFERRFRELVLSHERAFPGLKVDVEAQLEYYKQVAKRVQELTVDTIEYTNQAYVDGKRILVEGANATMLDIDFGTYPYVTSSNPSVGSVLTGLGVSPHKLRGVFGTVKAYCTRVGEGPFPTELPMDQGGSPGRHLSQVGAEYGTTTGRPRRCGWLDIPQMKYASTVNGFTSLNLTKLDVLTGLEEVKIGRDYRTADGQLIKGMPANLSALGDVIVEYEVLPGWTEDISHCKSFEELPLNCQKYVLRVQELLGIPIRWIGVGPNRADVIDRGEGYDLLSPDCSQL